MSEHDDRTDEQRKADEALDEAVRAVVSAYPPPSGGEGTGIVAQWVTLVNVVGHDDVGGWSSTSVLMPYGGGSTPWPQVFGLIRCAEMQLERDFLATGETT